MKKIIFALAGMTLFVACNDTSVAGTSKTNDSTATTYTKNSEAIYHAIETGDTSNLNDFIAEDIVDHNGGNNGQDIRGRDSVKAMLAQIHTYFDNFSIERISEATSADGNYHFALVRFRGTAKQNPWGMPMGMKMDDTYVDVVKISNNKATDHWGFMSNGDIMEMMQMQSSSPKNQQNMMNQPAKPDSAKY